MKSRVPNRWQSRKGLRGQEEDFIDDVPSVDKSRKKRAEERLRG
jgi:hypothetical protein